VNVHIPDSRSSVVHSRNPSESALISTDCQFTFAPIVVQGL